MRLLALAADNSEPDRRQAVKTGAIAPPLRGFGLDCLTPTRWWLIKQIRTYYERCRTPITDTEEAARYGYDYRITSGLEPTEIPRERGLAARSLTSAVSATRAIFVLLKIDAFSMAAPFGVDEARRLSVREP
jgi:hypothetical protein